MNLGYNLNFSYKLELIS